MDGVGVAERGTYANLLKGPVQCAVGVTHGQDAEGAGNEDFLAALGAAVEGAGIARVFPAVRLVEIDRRTEGQSAVGLAGHRESDIYVRVEFEFALAGDRTSSADEIIIGIPNRVANRCGAAVSPADALRQPFVDDPCATEETHRGGAGDGPPPPPPPWADAMLAVAARALVAKRTFFIVSPFILLRPDSRIGHSFIFDAGCSRLQEGIAENWRKFAERDLHSKT